MKKILGSMMIGLAFSTAALANVFATSGPSLKCDFGSPFTSDPTKILTEVQLEVPLTEGDALRTAALWNGVFSHVVGIVPLASKAPLPGEKFNFTLKVGNDLMDIRVSSTLSKYTFPSKGDADPLIWLDASLVDSQTHQRFEGACVIERASNSLPDTKDTCK